MQPSSNPTQCQYVLSMHIKARDCKRDQLVPLGKCGLTSALSGLREARSPRRRRDNGPRACGALAYAPHGPFQRIVGPHRALHLRDLNAHPHIAPAATAATQDAQTGTSTAPA